MNRVAHLLVALALALALTGGPDAATASPPRPADLRVVGGGDAWHADPRFALNWAMPPGGTAPSASGYRVRDPRGDAIREDRLPWHGEGHANPTVPRIPGIYTAEVWFEDAGGARGEAAVAPLRFDDTRPASIEPEPVPGWIGRSSLPLRVRLSRPPAPLPPSGIRGYAISIGGDLRAAPCAVADRCSDAETTLRSGAAGDTAVIAALPEGISYLSAVAVSGAGMRSAASGHIELRVDLTDPVTQLSGAPAGWAKDPVRLSASGSDGGAGMTALGAGPVPFTAIRIDGGPPQTAPGASVTATVAEEGAHRVAYYARDAAGNVADGSSGVAGRLPQQAWVRIDRTPPALAFAPSQDPRNPELLRARVADELSGADVGRGWIGVRRAGSGDRFARLPTAPPSGDELRARWDSDAFPPGEYEFQATGYDSAGNAAVTRRRRGGTPLVLSNPLKTSTSIEAAFAGRSASRIVRYGQGTRVAGRLVAGIRSPLGGMPVRIVERFAGGPAPSARTTNLRTGPDGAYSARLAPGSSREVVVTFPGNATLSRSTSTPMRLAVRSAVRMRASAAVARVGGAPLFFRGRVFPPEEILAEGKAVELQFRLAGQGWSEFRTIQTDRRGRFRYAYRFSDDDSRGARFQFRAFVPTQDDWPYEPGGSRPVIVLGA